MKPTEFKPTKKPPGIRTPSHDTEVKQVPIETVKPRRKKPEATEDKLKSE